MQTERAVVIAAIVVVLLMARVGVVLMRTDAYGLLSSSLVVLSFAYEAALPHSRKAKGEQQQQCYKTCEHAPSMSLCGNGVPVGYEFVSLPP